MPHFSYLHVHHRSHRLEFSAVHLVYFPARLVLSARNEVFPFLATPHVLNLSRYYLATSRELKRLDAVSRSPIFAWFSESLAGTSIIRAFGQQAIFITGNEQRLDHNQICYLPSIYVNRWLAVRLEFVGAMIIFLVASLAIFAVRTTYVDAGLVGLVISYALSTTSSLVRD